MTDEILELNNGKYVVCFPKKIIKAFKSIDNELSVCSNELPKILDYIHNLQDEIKELECLQDIRDQREYHKRYLEERRKEEPYLLYPDFDEVYKRFFEQRDRIDKAIEYIKWNLDKNEEIIEYFNYDGNFNELLDILKGGK